MSRHSLHRTSSSGAFRNLPPYTIPRPFLLFPNLSTVITPLYLTSKVSSSSFEVLQFPTTIISMSSALIHTSIPGYRTHFSLFPAEVLIEIFKLLFYIYSTPRNLINRSTFNRLQADPKCEWARIRKISKRFCALADLAFYESNRFAFLEIQSPITGTAALLMPPLFVRPWLRDFSITLGVSAWPGLADGVPTTTQLFTHCPVARYLQMIKDTCQGLRLLRLYLVVRATDQEWQNYLLTVAAADLGGMSHRVIGYCSRGRSLAALLE